MSEQRYQAELTELNRAVARLRAEVMAIVFGAVGGLAMFVATAWLVLRGGPVVGPHLGLLGNYFPGYSVSWPGAFLGALYGILCGAIAGWTIAWIYNFTLGLRHR